MGLRSAAASATLTAVIVIFAVAAVTVVPSLILLYVLSQRQALEGYSATSDVTSPRQ